MTTKHGIDLAPRVDRRELEAVAASLVLPDGCTDVCMVAGYKDGHVVFGPAWAVGGGLAKVPIAMYRSQHDARALFEMIAGPGGELWQRRERRRARLAELEALEAAAEAEAKEEAKALKKAGGDGSPPRAPSSSRPTGTTPKRAEETPLSLLRASARTSLELSSSSRARSRASSGGRAGLTTSPGMSLSG